MTPEKVIAQLDSLKAELNRLRSHLADEADQISEEWEALDRIGGQRADHAAGLLGRLRPHLSELSSFAITCEEQITGMVRDPFGHSEAV